MSNMNITLLALSSVSAAQPEQQQQRDDSKIAPPKDRDCVIGAFVGDSFDKNFPNFMAEFESKTGKALGIVEIFHPWGKDFEKIQGNGLDPFPAQACTYIKQNGSIPFIVWEPSKFNRDIRRNILEYINDPALRNEYGIDQYVTNWAEQAADFGGKIFMTFAPAMNGSDFAWCGIYNGGDTKVGAEGQEVFQGPQNYVKAWQWIVDKFREAGATNVTWVFSPRTVDTDDWNKIENYYPGDNYVDWIGLQGFNAEGRWSSFADMFTATLNKVAEKNKPIMISQTGTRMETATEAQTTVDNNGTVMAAKSKAQWIKEMIQMIDSEERIEALIWNDISTKFKGDIDAYGSLFGTYMKDTRFVAGYPAEEDTEKVRTWKPLSKIDLSDSEKRELEVKLDAYKIQFDKVLRQRCKTHDERYAYAHDLLLKAFTSGSDKERLDNIRAAGNQLQQIPKTVNSYYLFTSMLPVYFKAQTDLATVYLALGEKDKAVAVHEAVINDPDVTGKFEGFRISSVLNLCRIHLEYSSKTPDELLKGFSIKGSDRSINIEQVIEYADKVKDPNMFSSALMTKADILIRAGRNEDAMPILEKIFEWKGMPSQSLSEKIYGYFSSEWISNKDVPIWVANWEYMNKENSLFFADTVFAKTPRVDSLTRMAELYSLSDDKENKLNALAVFRELLTVPGAPTERIKENIKKLLAFLPEGLQ